MAQKKGDNQSVTQIPLLLQEFPSYSLGRWTHVVCTIKEGDFVLISPDFGKPIGGKTVQVQQIIRNNNVSGGFFLVVTGYDSTISINWVAEIIGRPKTEPII